MKKTALLLVALLLVSCGVQNGQPDNSVRNFSAYTNLYMNGEFLALRDMLYFTDFSSLKTVAVCPDPTCTHTNESTCAAKGFGNQPILYKDKIYYFLVEKEWDNENLNSNSILYTSDLNGTNRVKKRKLEGINATLGNKMSIIGDRLYFIGTKEGFNASGLKNDLDRSYLYFYDFTANSFEEVAYICDGLAAMRGIWNDSLYITYINSSDYAGGAEIAHYEARYSFSDDNIYAVDKEPVCISDNYILFSYDGGIEVCSDNEETVILPDYMPSELCGYTIVNDMLFSQMYDTVVDFHSGKQYQRSDESKALVLAYLDNGYVLREYSAQSSSYDYFWLSENDLIGQEVPLTN